mmetsp:Transcript_22771/g.32594  ORF Transcript_22771/g.32594 Transcript_22771/m.32594 type:complete len:97 (+) Transcript_22771:57-347(+)|eukprot:CAMPEP_0202458478 /NCGR_PEP_ID=MMETSP1360-20130828/25900_1 /ASSEMBLY_ACC=CAM_ASM_000848 /TAXON_ID=515479 /ORGANISM="Licmophora paradoxa, Strain CCMP2313" /LENGTH=96 /DNA_ID=CAMNT_0049079051 /DNA_START=57 /DNA_END=347 /DNA_ORIENTATION=-
MNALARTVVSRVPRTTPFATRGMAGSAAQSTPLKAGDYKDLCMKTWTSEPGAYPIMVILGLAVVGCTAYGTYRLSSNVDVRITPSKRAAIVRTWGK